MRHLNGRLKRLEAAFNPPRRIVVKWETEPTEPGPGVVVICWDDIEPRRYTIIKRIRGDLWNAL